MFLNGLGRGCLPADHELCFSRARSAALAGADVALVIGAPLDFRLGFGAAFAEDAEIVVIDVAEPERDHPRAVAAELYGALPATLEAMRGASGGTGCAPRVGRGVARKWGGAPRRLAGRHLGAQGWLASLREIETERRAAEEPELADPRSPLHPMRIYGELARCSTATRS